MCGGLPKCGSVGDGASLMRLPVFAAILLVCSGCNQKTEQPATNHVAATKNTMSTTNARSLPPSTNSSAEELPVADASLQFVGTWAANKASCSAKPWRFTKDEIRAADGSHCSIYDVSKVPSGYDLAVQCPAKKPDSTDLIKLRFAQSAQAMLVESNAIEPMGLINCGK